jgi:hypothetical protein
MKVKNKSPSKQVGDLMKAANEICLDVKFTHVKNGIFKYGTRQVTLMKKTNGVYARTGGGFIPLQEFVDKNESVEKRKSKR